jgi:hypothetical protein
MPTPIKDDNRRKNTRNLSAVISQVDVSTTYSHSASQIWVVQCVRNVGDDVCLVHSHTEDLTLAVDAQDTAAVVVRRCNKDSLRAEMRLKLNNK